METRRTLSLQQQEKRVMIVDDFPCEPQGVLVCDV